MSIPQSSDHPGPAPLDPPGLAVLRGHPLPLGPSLLRGGINFALFSRHATAVSLVIHLPGRVEPILDHPLDPQVNRTGDVWHAFIPGLDPGIEYGWRADRQAAGKTHLFRFDPRQVLVDPYAQTLSGGETWGGSLHLRSVRPGNERVRQRHAQVTDEAFDWGDDTPLNTHLADTIIYELHVRGFTRHPSSGVAHPGTYAGLIDKIPYLQELGVTAVELMPVTEFEENDNPNHNPRTGEPLRNFWGYHPISFFAVKSAYAADGHRGGPIREFRNMVRALHQAGIEVILDMVFNHTAEGDERGPTLSFRGLDNPVYYILEPETGRYRNYSGCGNTLNCNHPVVRDMILDSLRFWVTEMHVDGFRFDLASILGRGQDGQVLTNPPLLERIAMDPVLANTKLIAEAWDAAGLNQVGSFPHWGRWAEWNGPFRDDLRRFVKGDPNMTSALATRLLGSPDLYRGNGRAPFHSVNFVTCHDGFTLADLVSYNRKHNENNGEKNADGSDVNHSWNCGAEGPSPHPRVRSLRRRQTRNLAALLLLSQGVPMILAGDELGRSQSGNNNAYCQDNEISWLDWSLRDRDPGLFRFFQLLIRFRRSHPALRNRNYLGDSDTPAPRITWHGTRLGEPDWSWHSRTLALHLEPGPQLADIYLVTNAHWEPHRFALPAPAGAKRWHRMLDTALESPADILPVEDAPDLPDQRAYAVAPRSVVVLVAH